MLAGNFTASSTAFRKIDMPSRVLARFVSLRFFSREKILNEEKKSAEKYLYKAVLGHLPGTTVYRNVQQYPEAYRYSGILVVRIDAPISRFRHLKYYNQHVLALST